MKNIIFEDIFWLIGWLEAEGCIETSKKGRAAILSGECKDEDTIDRVCSLLNCKKYFTKSRNQNWSNTFRFRIHRLEIGTFLANASKFMSDRKQKQIATALEKMSSHEIQNLNWDESLKDKYFLYWLAGYLEGEGSFLAGPPSDPNMSRVQLQTTDEDISIEISAYLGVKYHRANPKKGYKVPFCILKRGRGAVDLMKVLFPFMSKRRKSQIQAAIKTYKVTPQRIVNAKLNKSDVEAIKSMRAEKMTFRQIAAHYGVSHPTIVRVCNGERYVSTTVIHERTTGSPPLSRN